MKNIFYTHILLALLIIMFWVNPCVSQPIEFTYYQVIDNESIALTGTCEPLFHIGKIAQPKHNIVFDLIKDSDPGDISLQLDVRNSDRKSFPVLSISKVTADGSLAYHSDNHQNLILLSFSGKEENGKVSFQLSSPSPDSFTMVFSVPFTLQYQTNDISDLAITNGNNVEQEGDKKIEQHNISPSQAPNGNKKNLSVEELAWNNANTLEKIYAFADEFGMNADIANRVNRMTRNLEIFVEQIDQADSFRFFEFKENKEYYFPFSPVELDLKEGDPDGILYPKVINNSGMGFQVEVLKTGKYIFGIKDKYGKTGIFRFDSNIKLLEEILPDEEVYDQTDELPNNNFPDESEVESGVVEDEKTEVDVEKAQTTAFDTAYFDENSSEEFIPSSKTEIISANLSSGSLFLKISGNPPFTLYFKNVKESLDGNTSILLTDKYLDNPSSSIKGNELFLYKIPQDSINNNFSGTYKISLQDANKLGDIYPDSIILGNSESSNNNATLIVIGFGVLLALFILIPLLRNLKLKDVSEMPKESINVSDNTEFNSIENGSGHEKMVIKSRNSNRMRKRQRDPSDKKKSEGPPKAYAADLNNEVKGKGYDSDELERSLHSADYCKLNMLDLWEDTSVEWVVWDRQCLIELNEFIKAHNSTEFSEETGDGIPEIGGFILGKYTICKEDNRYWVLLKKFVPVKAVQQGRYQVEFGVAWAGNQLAEVQDQYKDLETLAWFHTHPGHGLFLSHADLNIHQGFFRKRYQLAIEIDTLSENKDTAIFTRSKDGSVNNARDLHPDVSWFRWYDILKGGNIPV